LYSLYENASAGISDTVRVQEGREIQIGDTVNRVIDPGAMIQREVTRLLLPRAIASYKGGETLSFYDNPSSV
jgi:hypothetical protein